jgi:hypothetical protein
MIRFNTFRKLGIFNFINEAESTDTLIKKAEEDLSLKFDSLKEAKALKKPGDIKTKIDSINKQSQIYIEISNGLKTLGALYQKKSTEKKEEPGTGDIY